MPDPSTVSAVNAGLQEQALSFFTAGSIMTFGGASLAVWVVCNTFGAFVTKVDRKWPAFVTSMAIAFVGASKSGSLSGVVGVFLALLNGCLLFCSSAGVQAGANALPGTTPPAAAAPQAHGMQPAGFKARFFMPWF